MLEHSHAIKDCRQMIENFRAETRNLAVMSEEKPRSILTRAIAKLPLAVAETLPTVENMSRALRNRR
jgi:hypothetical protein